MNNPLLQAYSTTEGTTPFDIISPKHFIPALEEQIAATLETIDNIVAQTAPPTFENTIEALTTCGDLVERNSSLLFNLNSAATSPELQQVAQQAAPLLAHFQNNVRLNTGLYERIKTVYDTTDFDTLTEEQKMLLTKEFKGFVRNGAQLNEKDKETLRNIDASLAALSVEFGSKVLADKNAYTLHVPSVTALKGLPENAIATGAATAKEHKKEGYVFTLDYPSYVPFMTYVEDRNLRKEMSVAFGKVGFQDNENNTTDIIKKIVVLRNQRAKLLGYASHAAFVLEERMARDEESVFTFLDTLKEKAVPAAQKEWEQVSRFAEEELQIPTVEKWDTAFISEKIKLRDLALDEEALRPYFPLKNVVNGIFDIAGKLFQLDFKPATDISTYAEEVKAYRVFKNNTLHAILYLDFFPRANKRSGAWMTSYRGQKKGQRPHVSIVCNFTKPTATAPSLLTFNEVQTLFHEFGHALHGMLANTTYAALSGTNVYWDFVELPSQIMENWCFQKEALDLFARHFETGATLSQDVIDKLQKKAQFQQGLQTLRQLSFSYLDMSYHSTKNEAVTDIKAHEKAIFDPLSFTPDVAENCMSTSFAHIFQGGYASGYYSYKWAEVLDADAFELFLQNGIFDRATAQAFEEHILSKGGTAHPMDLYLKFRKQPPDSDALLRRAGLVEH